jgi:hypothetical protein
MAKALRVTLKSVRWTLAIVLVLALAIVAINAFDEDISPETAAFLKVPLNPYPAEENLYLALVGFDAPEGQSVFAAGQARVAQSEVDGSAFFKNQEAFKSLLERRNAQPRTRFKGKVDFCKPLSATCWIDPETHGAEIETLLKDNDLLYQRYLALYSLRGYFDTEKPSYFMIFPGSAPFEVQALLLADTARRIKTGRTREARAAALARLRDDVEMWRMMLTGQGGLVSKMISVAHLQPDYALLSDMVADPAIDLTSLAPIIEEILNRISADDWKLHNLFAAEARISAAMLEQLQAVKEPFFRSEAASEHEETDWRDWVSGRAQHYFFKVDATQNLGARMMIETQRMADAAPRDLLAAQETRDRWNDRNLDFGPSYIYNPVGKLMVAIAAPAYDEYPLRVYDVAAFVRAARLGYEIRKARVSASDIPAFIREHPEWGTHPASGEPFVWDPQTRQIRVRQVARAPRERRFYVPVWTP